MIQEAIARLAAGQNMEYETAAAVMNEIMDGVSTAAQNAAFLTALHIKGETIDEITACAEIMREHCAKFTTSVEERLEIVGTGGDRAATFNISSISAIVASACGAHVAKHGNRAASSKCGAADVLEALGVKLDTDTKNSEDALEELGICFLFAQKYHPAMRFVGAVRKEIAIPTVFNILGPLANPAKANLQLLGVYDQKLVEPLSRVLSNLGVKRGVVVHGLDGLDEITLSARTTACEIEEGSFRTYEINPEDYGFTLCKKEELTGGTPAENAQIARDILDGKKGAKRDAVLLNTGVALHIAKRVPIAEGIRMAAEAIDSGRAKEQLAKFAEYTNRA